MKNKNYELSIVIPCYNEIKGLPLLIENYRETMKNINFQLIIVDNGSKDGTWDYLQSEIKKPKNEFIKAIKIENNIGYGYGIQKGLESCNSENIGWSHGDLQCSPKDVFRAYLIYKGFNDKKILIKGYRKCRNWKELFLSCGLDIYTLLILFRIYNDINGQPKILHRNLLQSFRNPPKGFTYDLFVQHQALKRDYKIYSFRVYYKKRIYGLSKWAYSMISKFSTIKDYMEDILKMRLGVYK